MIRGNLDMLTTNTSEGTSNRTTQYMKMTTSFIGYRMCTTIYQDGAHPIEKMVITIHASGRTSSIYRVGTYSRLMKGSIMSLETVKLR